MRTLRSFLHARLWTIFTCLCLMACVMMLWLITPSTLLFRPIEWVYDPKTKTVAFTRVINAPRELTVRWAHIIYIPDGESCSAGGIRPFDARTQIEFIKVHADLSRCLDNPHNVAVLSWSPLMWGFVPLRPFTMTVPQGAEIPRAAGP